MAKNNEERKVRVVADGKQATATIKQMQAAVALLNAEMKKLPVNSQAFTNKKKEYQELQARLKQTTNEMYQLDRASKSFLERNVRVVSEGKQVTATIRQMQAAVAVLNEEMKELPVNSQAFTNKKKEYQELQARLRQTTNEVYQLDRASKSFWKDFKSLAGAMVGGNLITGMIQKIQMLGSAMLQSKINMEESLADIRKVTGMTSDELDMLQKNISGINTRTSRGELNELAYAAGKLGIQGVDNVSGFVRAADKINVALGKDLGKDAIPAIGKLVSIFQLEDEFGLEKSMLKVGSAINEIGAASTASEGYLVEFAKRMSGVSGIVGLSAPDIIGMAGTLDSLGQTAEVSSNALSKLFVKMGSDTATFAKYAGMNIQDFSKLLKEDAMEAFIQVLSGVEKTAGGVESLSATLGELGLDGGRVVGVLGSLATNVDELRKQQDIANKSFQSGTSVIDEFNLKNETLGAKFEKLGKMINGYFIKSKFSDFIARAVDGLSKFADTAEDTVQPLKDSYGEFIRLGTALKDSNISNETRAHLIERINKNYKEYLPELIKEGDSLERIKTLLAQANKEFEKKILMTTMEQELTDIYKKRIGWQRTLIENEKQLANLRTGVPFDNNFPSNNFDINTNPDIFKGVGNTFAESNSQEIKDRKIKETFAQNQIKLAKDQIALYEKQVSELEKEFAALGGILTLTKENKDENDNTNASLGESVSLLSKIRDLRTNLLEDAHEKERESLKNKFDDEVESIKKSKAIESEKIEAIALLEQNYFKDLRILKINQAKETSDAELKAKTEALAEFEAIEKLYYAKMVENGQMTQKEQAQWNKQVDIAILEEKKRLYEEYGKSVAEIDLALAEARIKISKDESDKQRLSAIAEQQYRVAAEREGSRARLQEELALLDMEMQAELNAHILTEEQKKLIEDAFRQQKADKEKAHARQMVELAQKYIGEIANIYGSFMAIKSNKEEGEFNQYKTQEEAKKAKLEERLSKGLISEKGYRHQLEAIDKDLREREKQFKTEQFIRQKRADMISAGINTALAVTRALSTDPTGILATIVGIAGAAQIAAINSKPVPQFAMGGRTDVVGAQDGKKYSAKQVGSFANGGAYSNASVGLIGEKGPELVVPSWIYTAPSMAGVMDVLETMISTKQFAMGGATSTKAPVMQMPQNTDYTRKFDLLIMEMKGISEKLDKPFIAKTLWNQTEFERIQHIEEVSKKKSTL